MPWYLKKSRILAIEKHNIIAHKRMKPSEQTIPQIQRALRKVALKFPPTAESFPMTDLTIQVKQDDGELLVFDDDNRELWRCVVEEWIGDTSEDFYEKIQPVLKEAILGIKEEVESMNLLRPYSLVLADEEGETVCDLYLVDDETLQLDGDLMEGLDDDLDQFWEALAAED